MITTKVLCGRCGNVLFNPAGRTPMRGEQAQLDAMPPLVERGRLLYNATRPRENPADVSWIGPDHVRVYAFHCTKCHVDYQPAGFLDLVDAATKRGEPVVLLPPPTRR